MSDGVSDKGFVPTLLLCFFFGVLGVHRFYVGKIGTGLLQLITIGGLGIWALVDFILIVVGSFTDKQGRPIKASNEFGDGLESLVLEDRLHVVGVRNGVPFRPPPLLG